MIPVACEDPVSPPDETHEEVRASVSSIVRGGLIYDKWWRAVFGAPEPETDHPLWALQDTNKRSGSTTWRCKECHGWDYKGKDGAYSEGSHYTGFPEVYDTALVKTNAQLLDTMMDSTDYQHDFSSVLSEVALTDLVNFLKEGTIDMAEYIDYASKKPIGASVTHGKDLYTETCTPCHSIDGQLINFGSETEPEYLGALANSNPWETLHKIRFGQPGTGMPTVGMMGGMGGRCCAGMPSAVASGWSVQDAVDVLAYAQTLPK